MKRMSCGLLILGIFLASCSNSPSMKSAMGSCDTIIKTDFSAGDTLRFTYSIDKQNEVNALAENWCGDRKKSAKRSSINCNGCCSATYLCTKQ
jgi:hypothetical protein